MGHTFDVSDVARDRTTPYPHERALMVIRSRIRKAEAGACNLDALVSTQTNPFVEAAQLAFADHHELALSPDDVWLCIAQGFAQHVSLHHEELRGRFVRHDGRAQIVVIRDEFRRKDPTNDWPGVFGEFSDAIARHIGKQRDLVVGDFSTTGPVEKAASEVVLMAAMQQYFAYVVKTRCGIPRITLLGTPEDWQSIRRRAHHLAEYGLEHWLRALSPILDELCAAAAGRPNRQLWQSFYKYRSWSGGSAVSGWINTLFPYVREEGFAHVVPNDHLDWQSGDGPEPSAFPLGLATAPFVWDYLGSKIAMEFIAGFMGVSQDPQTLGVRPAIGWAVHEAAV